MVEKGITCTPRPALKQVSSTNVQCSSDWPPLPGQSRSQSVAGQQGAQQVCVQSASDGAREIDTVLSGNFQPAGYEWASVVEAEATAASTPVTVRNRFAPLGSTTDDDERQQFKVVQPRCNKRSYRQSADVSRDQPKRTNQLSTSNNNPPQLRRAFVYGKSTVNSAIVAAERMKKKAVFCIDNVSPNCTADQMKSFVESMGIEVFTCFKVRSRRRRDENDESVDKRSAFRVCICVDDSKRLLDPRAWPHSIAISGWFFKQSSRDAQDASDKRRRVGSDDRSVQLQWQRAATQSQEESSDGGAVGGVVEVNQSVSRDSTTTTTTAVTSCSTPMDNDVADGDDDEHTVIMSEYKESSPVTQDGSRPQ